MLWLLSGVALLGLFLMSLRAFDRAPIASPRALLPWALALGGLLVSFGLLLSGRASLALAGLVLAAPLLWRNMPLPRSAPPPPGRGGMTRAEAYEVLGLRDGASQEDIRLAHTRLIRAAHPDAGGSNWLASRVNQARDILLG